MWHSDSVPIGALAKAQAALPASCLCKQWEDEALLHEDERILYLSSRIICVHVMKVLGSIRRLNFHAVGEDLQVVVCEMVSC